MVTRAVNGSIHDDREVLRYVVRELNQDVGVYANVVQPGVIAAGDEVVIA
jgi:MOSC domain-containing protein YiiM